VRTLGGRPASIAIGIATAIVIVAVAIIPFLTPAWIGFEQGRAQAQAWTGYGEADLRTATNAILADLVVGPPDFDVAIAGVPVLNDRERGHMRDVRTVFGGLAIAAVVSVIVLLLAAVRRKDTAASWRAVRQGAFWLAAAVVGLGVFALIAFDTLFEVFHEVLFPAGSYDFDPATERLVQLFPFQFWQESAIAVGIVIIAISAVVGVVAHVRSSRPSSQAAADQVSTPTVAEPG
jgi:integral membrane protein (TIGR01906 family)